jgi:DNA-binding response OmpR family regulator
MAEHTGGSVLLVEDDAPFALIVARHLAAHGIPTEVASSAEDAERRLAGGLRPALVLLDINLPGETGWSLLRQPAYAGAGSPPVVVVSATNVPRSRLREHGVAGYLPKPFPIATLVATIERLLSPEGSPAEP